MSPKVPSFVPLEVNAVLLFSVVCHVNKGGEQMRRLTLFVILGLAAALLAFAPAGTATIHPIVESFDCANEQAFANHPLGDPADPLGQTPGDLNPAGNPTGSKAFTALDNANANAFSEHKLNGQCGKVGQP
jgi:hypothetical protein